MPDLGDLLGHGEEGVGACPPLDLHALGADRALMDLPQRPLAGEGKVVAPQPHLRRHDLGEVAQGCRVLRGEVAWLRIGEAEGAEPHARPQDQRCAGVKHDVRRAGHDLETGKARVAAGIGNDEHRILRDRPIAERACARRLRRHDADAGL
ncbi:hypothetical protein M2440_004940 [Methylorubrum extorquens]|nr:hypothetical protein [Methylorubrum extorquens]